MTVTSDGIAVATSAVARLTQSFHRTSRQTTLDESLFFAAHPSAPTVASAGEFESALGRKSVNQPTITEASSEG